MKKIGKKWGSLLLAGLLLAASLPIGALAQEPAGEEPAPQEGFVYQWGDGDESYALRETQDTLGGGEAGRTAAQTFSAPLGSYDDGSFYGQLTARQKACYDALAAIPLSQILTASENQGYKQVRVGVDEFYGLGMTGYILNQVFTPSASSEPLYRQLYTDICAAITALRYDKADALWLSDMRYGIYVESTSGGSVDTREILFGFRLHYGGQEQEMYDQQMASAQAIADKVDRDADLYEQVMQVHDLLAAQSTYNKEPADSTAENLSHQAYSCLVAGDAYEPVCDGYAKAVKVVCDLLEIPSTLAISENHMWNNIKMDDGDWYNLDLTWDDTGDAGSHSYFLVGSQTLVDGVAFSKQPDHVERNIWIEDSQLNSVTFRYPSKNPQAYVYVEGGYDPLRFPDVKRSAWYYSYVESAADMGLFVGDEKGFFNPKADITRAQFVQVLYNAVAPEDYTPAELTFRDVPAGKWYTNAVAWASEMGVVAGYEDGNFRPGANIIREEMCVVLENYRHLITDAQPEPVDFTFPDDEEISSWAKEAVYNCYDYSLISGDERSYFNPTDNTIRCEAATVFTKYVLLLEQLPPKEEQPEDPDEETPSKPDDSSSSEEPSEPATPPEDSSSSEGDSSSSQDSSSSGTGSGSSSDSSQESSSSSEETSLSTTNEDSETHQAPGP